MPSLYDGKRDGVDARIAGVASRQHGVFTRRQAERCGATEGMIRWRTTAGRWERLYPSVFRLAGTTTTWHQLATAACLSRGPGAVLSHRPAAALRSLAGVPSGRIEVTVPRNRHHACARGMTVHWTQEPIPEEDVTTFQGIRVTKPARTLLDLATVEPEEVIERCLDDALRRKLVSLPFLQRWLADPRRKRHRGARVLRRLVKARATVGVTESPLETEVLRLLRDAGLPIPMLQYDIHDGDRFIARVDFAYPEARVAIEADGFRFHAGRRSFDDDRARGNEILALGWQVLHVTSTHLEQDPDAVVGWVSRALESR